jgi:hypothetical protein
MRKRKIHSIGILVLFLVQVIFGVSFSGKVKAEETDSSIPQFMDVRKETIGFVHQYKNKTIVNNNVITDYNLKFFVEENGQKHIISEDFELLRWLRFIGIYNDNVYVVPGQDEKKTIYKADLNTYKLDKVKDVPIYGDGKAGITNYKIASDGVLWFQAQQNNIPIYDSVGRLKDYNTKYIIYNDKGFSYETLNLQDGTSSYSSYGGLNEGPDGTMWFHKSFDLGADNKVYRILKDNSIKEYSINSAYRIESVHPRPDNTLFVFTKELVKTQTGYNENKGILQIYKVNKDALELVKNIDVTGKDFFKSIDSNGNLWINEDGLISKLENDSFVAKYAVRSSLSGINVYDDKHLAAIGIVGFGYTPISIEETVEKPEDNTNDGTDSNNSPAEQTPALEKFTIVVNSNKEALVTLNSSKILKDSVNEIMPTLSSDIQVVEAKIEASSINGGKGSLKVNANNIIMELPFSTIDFNGTSQSDFVSLKQNIVKKDASLNSLKSIGKLFDFSLATYKQDGTRISDIHAFKSGKAKISVKLTNEEVKGLDITKLAAFYYNESTKLWEEIGGSYNKETMIFTFETSHFSKYTIAQVNGTLPQTGSVVSFTNLMLLAVILILTGSGILFSKGKIVKAISLNK